MVVLYALLTVFIIIYVVFFFVERDVEGYKFTDISDMDLLRSLEQNINNGVNGYFRYDSRRIWLKIGGMPDIKTTFMRIYGFKFHMEGVGLIPFWYKSHKVLNKIYKLKRAELLIKRKEDEKLKVRRKLGLE